MQETKAPLVTNFSIDNDATSKYGLHGVSAPYNNSFSRTGFFSGSMPGAADSNSIAFAGNNITGLPSLFIVDSNAIGSIQNSLSCSYLRGELSGGFAVLNGIVSSTIPLSPAENYSDFGWTPGGSQTFISRHELSHYNLKREKFDYALAGRHYALTGSIETWKTDSVLSVLARIICGETHLVIRSTEVREQLKVTAVANMLVILLIAVIKIVSSTRSIFTFSSVTRIIIRLLMAHRNSREPAHSLSLRALFYISRSRGYC